MATAKATLIGMYNFDSAIFDKMVLPDGIDKSLFIDTLLLKAGEFEVLYFDPLFLQNAIGVWSNKWYRTFAEWLRGTKATWNPIHNYDRIEDIFDSGSKTFGTKKTADYSDVRTADLKEQRTANLQEQRTADLQEQRTADLTEERTANLTDEQTLANSDTTSQTVSGTTEHEVSAYDSSSYVPSSRDTINNGETQVSHDGTITNTHTGTDTNTTTGTDTTATTGTDTMATTGTDTNATTGTDTLRHSGTLSDENGSESHSDTHTAHVYGNIGVTQSGDMLRNFYDISTWNLYDHMADTFTQELLIPVY